MLQFRYLLYVFIHKIFFGLILPVFKYLNSYVPKSTMGAVDPSNDPSPPPMMSLEINKFDTNTVNRYPPNII